MEALAIGTLFVATAVAAYTGVDFLLAAKRAIAERGVRNTSSAVSQLDLPHPAEYYFALRAGSAAALFVLGCLAVNGFLGLLLAWVAYVLPGMFFSRAIHKRRRLLSSQLVDGLGLMSNALKSGMTLTQAIELMVKESADPLSKEFSRTLAENRLGVEIKDALNSMADRVKLPVISILATGVSVTSRCGGDLAEIFQHIADTIRAKAALEGKIEAVSSLGRFQALILSSMPFLLMGLLFFLDRPHVEMLFETKIGVAAVGAMVLLVVAANLWIQRLIRIDV